MRTEPPALINKLKLKRQMSDGSRCEIDDLQSIFVGDGKTLLWLVEYLNFHTIEWKRFFIEDLTTNDGHTAREREREEKKISTNIHGVDRWNMKTRRKFEQQR